MNSLSRGPMSMALWLALVACGPHGTIEHGGPARAGEGSGARARSGSGRSKQAVLAAHNARRRRHCAPPLKWSPELARVAQGWAKQLARRDCTLVHSTNRFGENLAAGSSGLFSAEDFVDMWYREVDGYRFRRGRFSVATGHFTQLVWRATRSVGCAWASCGELEVFVCNYDPAGNVEGLFVENVRPEGCRGR